MANRRTILVLIVVLLLGAAAQAKYSGGMGEPNDPYLIATAEDMNAIGAYPSDWNKHFLLVADINLADYTGTQFKIIGTSWNKPFQGVFDGNNHKVWNFTCTSTRRNDIGLFGWVDGQIKNLGMENVNVKASTGGDVGGLVGGNIGTITNCYFAGSVTGSWSVGGLVGGNYGTITNCYSAGSVSGDGDVGVLVGYNRGAITDCYSIGRVSGDEDVGGLVGENYGTITNCYSIGSIKGNRYVGGLMGENDFDSTITNCCTTGSVWGDDLVGGLTGWNDGTISTCYATGSVLGQGGVGGLVGVNCWYGTILNCYANGSVSGDDYVGGLVGSNCSLDENNTISNCFATGAVNGNGYIGGLVGDGDANDISSSFWDVNTSGQTSSDGGEGKTTAEMQTESTFTNAGWDFVGETANGPNEVWTIDEGNDYPHLAWEGKPGQPILHLSNFLEGSGTQDDPYQVSTPEELNLIGLFTCELDKHFVLVNDVDLAGFAGTQFNIIGTDYYHPFAGVFDGNNYKIWNFTWSSTGGSYIGLFGYIAGTGQIKNLGMEDVDVNAVHGSYVGGLVGYNRGSISNCYSTGRVSGGTDVGGLIGNNTFGTISNCSADGSVSGNKCVGELVGINYGTISDCSANGSVTGGELVGGLVGFNNETISTCYATGSVLGQGSVGGLVGGNYSTISDCSANGSVTGDELAGGLVGINGGTISSCYAAGAIDGNEYTGGLVGGNGCNIENCYSTGSVSGLRDIGGLVGVNGGTISNCYSIGSVSGNWDAGGLVGVGGGVINSFWDVETSGQLESAVGHGKTTAEMKMASTYLGWGGCGNYGVWTIDDGNDYPHLAWEGKPGQPIAEQQLSDYVPGSGTESDPYLISTAQQLNLIGVFPCEWDKHFALIVDINIADYNGTQVNIIGGSGRPFTGVFDGNGHKVWNFTWDSNGGSYIGLFGYVGTGGQIKNLGMENVNINVADGDCIGGLVGGNEGTITNCYSTGSISGNAVVGGLVGDNFEGTISNCYANGSVSGYGDIGGLVGLNYGTISNCFATGNVSTEDRYSGGLVGSNGGNIENCYATGSVSGLRDIGGLVGGNYGMISDCYASGSVTGGGEYSYCIGGLVGDNYGTITNCYATGGVDGNDYTGGLVGENRSGTISDCNATGNISGEYYVGGLVGANGGTISNCYSTGSVDGNDCTGGLAGGNYSTTSNCYATGSVSGEYFVGGLVGINDGTITNCYSTGSVDGNDVVGGLLGQNGYYGNGTITNCYSIGSVSGDTDVGGLVGKNGYYIWWRYYLGYIYNCYSVGAVVGDSNVGGLVGENIAGGTFDSFWDVNTSGQTTSDGGTGLPTEQMQIESTFTNAGWDFVCETENGTDEVWTIKEGVDYPKLFWQWKDYQEWLAVNKPPCWLCPRQCHGDADNTSEYIKGKGYYHVHFKDLNLLLSAWNIKEPNDGNPYPGGLGIAWPDPNICADFNHGIEGGTKTGYFRVHFNDLNILLKYWNVKEPPGGPGIEPNCLDCP